MMANHPIPSPYVTKNRPFAIMIGDRTHAAAGIEASVTASAAITARTTTDRRSLRRVKAAPGAAASAASAQSSPPPVGARRHSGGSTPARCARPAA